MDEASTLVLSPRERTKKFRREVKQQGGRRVDVALEGAALAALDVVTVRRGLRYPRHVFATLLVEERSRLENTLRPERPELTALNSGLIVRSILACLPPTLEGERQRVLADLLGPLLRAAIETMQGSAERLSLLQLLTYLPLTEMAVQRAVALFDTTEVSAATRRAFNTQVRSFLARPDRHAYFDLLQEALETMLWNGLLRG